MKRFSPLTLTAIVMIAFAAVSCQKDSGADNTTQAASTTNELSVKGQATTLDINGLISQATADKMKGNYKNNGYKSQTPTEYVAFSIKDLSNYIELLKVKYKSDSIYVYTGIYDDGTAKNKNYVGRQTIYFMGKNNVSSTGDVKSQFLDVYSEDLIDGSNYLNHGNIYP